MDPDIQDVTVVQYESVRPPGLGFLIQNFADFTKGQEKTDVGFGNIHCTAHKFLNIQTYSVRSTAAVDDF